jgi:hypothetical protein
MKKALKFCLLYLAAGVCVGAVPSAANAVNLENYRTSLNVEDQATLDGYKASLDRLVAGGHLSREEADFLLMARIMEMLGKTMTTVAGQ